MIAVGTGDFGDGPRNGMTQRYQSPLSPQKKFAINRAQLQLLESRIRRPHSVQYQGCRPTHRNEGSSAPHLSLICPIRQNLRQARFRQPRSLDPRNDPIPQRARMSIQIKANLDTGGRMKALLSLQWPAGFTSPVSSSCKWTSC